MPDSAAHFFRPLRFKYCYQSYTCNLQKQKKNVFDIFNIMVRSDQESIVLSLYNQCQLMLFIYLLLMFCQFRHYIDIRKESSNAVTVLLIIYYLLSNSLGG